jgi:hypothetical protein
MSAELASRWRTRAIYEGTKPREPIRVNLGPLRRRESNGALHKALVFWHRWTTTGVFRFFHVAQYT